MTRRNWAEFFGELMREGQRAPLTFGGNGGFLFALVNVTLAEAPPVLALQAGC